ncbi:MAG: hypothetical protein ABSE93_12150 [Terriglobia bacterium]
MPDIEVIPGAALQDSGVRIQESGKNHKQITEQICSLLKDDGVEQLDVS